MLKNNTANVYSNTTSTTPIASSTTPINIFDATLLTVVKTSNKLGVYFPGDKIVFTIVLTNLSLVAMNGLVVKDVIDPAFVPATGTDFVVTATTGTIASKKANIEVNGINIPTLGTATITIEGVVA